MTENRANTTIPDFSDEELLRSAHDEGFMYPFTNKDDFAEIVPTTWEDSLGESCRNEKGLYVKPGFDLQATVRDRSGPALELGGPTTKGYVMLEGISLPNKPLITNLRGNNKQKTYEEYQRGLENGEKSTQKWGSETLNSLDKLVLDGLFDATRLAVADKKVGVLLSSCMENINLRQLHTSIIENDVWDPEVQAEIADRFNDQQYMQQAEAIINNPEIVKDAEPDSPRLATIVNAARVLEPGGVCIFHGVGPEDVKVAQSLGLELVMHTPAVQARHIGMGDALHTHIEEVVFCKPADQYSDAFDQGHM